MFLDSSYWVILHVSGALIAMSAAFYGDFSFLRAVRDKIITLKESKRIHRSGKIVWFGLSLIVLSGIGLVMGDPDRFLHSDKFLAKMTIVFLLIINGVVFHKLHIPSMKKSIGKKFSQSKDFVARRPLFLLSGSLSAVSWLSAFTLGNIKSTPYTYSEILTVYFALVAIASASALLLRERIIPIKS